MKRYYLLIAVMLSAIIYCVYSSYYYFFINTHTLQTILVDPVLGPLKNYPYTLVIKNSTIRRKGKTNNQGMIHEYHLPPSGSFYLIPDEPYEKPAGLFKE